MNPNLASLPCYWVPEEPEEEVRKRLGDRWTREWLPGWRDFCRNTDERTPIAEIVPFAAIGQTFSSMFIFELEVTIPITDINSHDIF